jgi:stage III sporulation protein AH
MQPKKQTVWLVSMLSLMVVLSAYYLFTDDVKQTTKENWNKLVLKDVSASSTPTMKKTDQSAVVQSSTSDYFANAQMQRDEKQEAEFDRLMQTMNNADDSKSAETMKTLGDLQDRAEKVSALEDQLANEYDNAVIAQNDGKWDVTVQSNSLQRAQAVGITELVMHELGATPNQIAIHTVK